MDYTLSASVYNGDQPIQKPPLNKPVTLGSLNFSTLKSYESKTSKGSQSFRLPRLTLLDDSLNRSIEKLMTKETEHKKKKFSPYRSSSQKRVTASSAALSIVNAASATSTSALKLRKYTKTQARPLSARSSTPVVPKPGAKNARPKSGSRERKVATLTDKSNKLPPSGPVKNPGKLFKKPP